MAGIKRKRGSGYRGIKKKKMIRRKSYSRPSAGLRYKHHQLDRCFIKCQRFANFTSANVPSGQTGAAIIFGNMAFDELRHQAKFNRYASMYSFFRVHSMKCIFNSQGHIAICQTSYDPDTDTVATYQTQVSANINCRTHQLLDGKISSRSVKLGYFDKYREFMSTQGCNTVMQEEKYKSCIQYLFTGMSGSHYNVAVTEEYVVEFRGLRDKFSTSMINPGAMNSLTAVGPGDQPVYFEATTNP
jgi:hypothetical protein